MKCLLFNPYHYTTTMEHICLSCVCRFVLMFKQILEENIRAYTLAWHLLASYCQALS